MNDRAWRQLNRRIESCELCPRLRRHCLQIAETKRKAYQDWDYWGGPVANFGAADARLLIVGLAPGAHGANRTGRMFTGDRSGDWLYRALERAGFANQAEATSRDDGLTLSDCAITAICHCAPPDNKPTADEISACQPWLQQTFDLLSPSVFVALGGLAWNGAFREMSRRGWWTERRPKFGHGERVQTNNDRWVLGSYHPSQQNTFTGRLTEKMLDEVFDEARRLLDSRDASR